MEAALTTQPQGILKNSVLRTVAMHTDVALAIAVIGILALMIIPMPPLLLDILLASNITLAILVLMVSMYLTSPLEMSVFPGLLLILTIFRL